VVKIGSPWRHGDHRDHRDTYKLAGTSVLLRALRASVVSFFLISFLPTSLPAQKSIPDSLVASRVSEPLRFNGKPDEAVWQSAQRISNFTQREQDFGKPATEKTEVAIAYDEQSIWIAIWCYQKDMSRVVAKSMQRDFDYEGEDHFQVLVSPFNDQRNGYLFVINPLGARADILVAGNESYNEDWNGIWDAKTSRDALGWYAEIVIPYNALKFKNEERQEWALNFERYISYKSEQVRWQGWSRDHNIGNISVAGRLTGLVNIRYDQRFELKPYALGGWSGGNDNEGLKPNGKIGADLNWNVSTNLKLNLTTNTDFAQVEADRIQVNLTRFNLYYPEKREFFLEGSSFYSFNLGQTSQIFYTRKIGLENREPVNVLGGARLFGKEGKNNIGFLSLQTAGNNLVPSTNNTVLRYKRDIGAQSYIGGIITSKYNQEKHNLVAGIDASFTTSKFLKDKNLILFGAVGASMDNGVASHDNISYRFYIDYPNDLIDNYIATSSIPAGFNAELGYFGRQNFDAISWNLNITPRILKKYGFQQFEFNPWEFVAYWTHTTGELESISNETRLLGFQLKSGDKFEYNIHYNYDRLDIPFELTDFIVIPEGNYHFVGHQVQVESYQGRKVWGEIAASTGKYYLGDIRSVELALGVNVSSHLNVKADYELNYLKFGQTEDFVQQLAAYVNYAFSTRLDLSLFSQWNTEDDLALLNFRIHWIPRIGSDFYFVLNNGYEPVHQAELMHPNINSGAAKLVWRFTF